MPDFEGLHLHADRLLVLATSIVDCLHEGFELGPRLLICRAEELEMAGTFTSNVNVPRDKSRKVRVEIVVSFRLRRARLNSLLWRVANPRDMVRDVLVPMKCLC